MEKTVQVKYLRIAPKKMQTLRRAFIGKNAKEVILTGRLSPKKGFGLIGKAVKSALSLFAVNEQEQVKVKNVIIGQGPRFKRARPGGRGAQHMYLKRTSHLQVVLESPKK